MLRANKTVNYDILNENEKLTKVEQDVMKLKNAMLPPEKVRDDGKGYESVPPTDTGDGLHFTERNVYVTPSGETGYIEVARRVKNGIGHIYIEKHEGPLARHDAELSEYRPYVIPGGEDFNLRE